MERTAVEARAQPLGEAEGAAQAFADEWWRTYVPKQHQASLYNQVEGLLKQLSGEPAPPVRLLKLSWIESWVKRVGASSSGLALPRRQQLERDHPEAFLNAEEVRGLPLPPGFASLSETSAGARIAAISHAWATPTHPDPKGEQLTRFVNQVSKQRGPCPRGRCVWLCPATDDGCLSEIEPDCPGWRSLAVRSAMLACWPLFAGCAEGCVCGCIPYRGQGCGHSVRSLPHGEFALFYDYASLPQKDDEGRRTPDEHALFQTALDKMGSWYAHSLATTFVMDVPSDSAVLPYAQRGWPTFERAVSALAKPSAGDTYTRIIEDSRGRNGRAYRTPPMHPKAFACVLASKVFTNGKSDCELVASLYADTLMGAFGHSRKLEFSHCNWGDDELHQLAQVLHFAKRVTILFIDSNPGIGKRGLDALAVPLEEGSNPFLTNVVVSQPERSELLCAVCRRRKIRCGLHI